MHESSTLKTNLISAELSCDQMLTVDSMHDGPAVMHIRRRVDKETGNVR